LPFSNGAKGKKGLPSLSQRKLIPEIPCRGREDELVRQREERPFASFSNEETTPAKKESLRSFVQKEEPEPSRAQRAIWIESGSKEKGKGRIR